MSTSDPERPTNPTVADDQHTAQAKDDAPAPDDARKPDSPSQLHPPSWKFTAKNALHQFSRDQCTDLAAALTYYSVMALFPGLLALVSLLGVFGDARTTTQSLLSLIRQVAPGSAADQLEPIITNMIGARGAGLALAIGIIGALWSASGYVGAFSRAMNRVYQVDEGRPMVKMRLMQLGMTLVIILTAVIMLLGLTVSGSLTTAIGNRIGLGSTAQLVWSIAKYPVMLAVMVMLVALLYYFTPNVKQPKFRWVSVGAAVAILVWVLASLAFGFYVANFGNYNATYGALAGVIVMLLWLWITNLALMVGAEVDAEMERARQLQAGMRAEETLQLPPKDTKASDKKAEKQEQAVKEARALRIGATTGSTQTAGKASAEDAEFDADGFVVPPDTDTDR